MSFKRILRHLLNRICSSVSVLTGSSTSYSNNTFAFHSLTFSQEGEDCILGRIFDGRTVGFYVDVGAHHPQRFSNTYRFYLRAWNGINIDPLPGSASRFDALRARDINLELGISDSPGELIYHSFQEPACNTFDPTIAAMCTSLLLAKQRVRVRRLDDVLDEYLPSGKAIDFLSVDVEGLDLQVLRSNDWRRYRPTYVLVEALAMSDVYQVLDSELHVFMQSQGYSLFAKCLNTLFFVDSRG